MRLIRVIMSRWHENRDRRITRERLAFFLLSLVWLSVLAPMFDYGAVEMNEERTSLSIRSLSSSRAETNVFNRWNSFFYTHTRVLGFLIGLFLIVFFSILGLSLYIFPLKAYRDRLEDLVTKRTAELRASEERQRAQYKGIPVPTYSWQSKDDDFILIDYNDAAEQITYGKVAGLLGAKASQLYQDQPQIIQEMTRCLTERSTVETEMLYQLKSTGETKYFLVKYGFIPPDIVIVHTEDITDRTRTEAALRSSEARFRTLVDSMDDVVFTLDLEQRHTGVFGRWLEKQGLSPEFFLGKTSREILGPQAAKVHESANMRALAGEHVVYEWAVPGIDKSLRSIQTLLSPIRDSSGAIIGLVGVGRDMTEKKQTEEALRNSEERYRLLAEYSTDMISRHTQDGTYLYVSPACRHLLGYEPQDLVGHNAYEFFHPDDLAQIQQSHCHITEQNMVATVHYRILCKDGSYVWFETTSQTIQSPESPTVHEIVAVSRNITERKQVENDLQHAKEEAERANRAKSTFLANMSHELRTPLNAILGFARLMERNPPHSSKQQEYLGIISRSGEHLLALINDILDLSKIEAGWSHLQLENFDLYRMLHDIETMMSPRAAAKGIGFIIEYQTDVPHYIKTDEQKLRQVLINLIGNAIKFTEQGSVTVSIAHNQLQTERAAMINLHCSIVDTGPGMAPEELEKLFSAFVQTRSGQKSGGGSGLGLVISRQFIRMLGGELTVKSDVASGSVFQFEAPCQLASEKDITRVHSFQRVIGLASNQPSYRILIIEDDWESRLLLNQLLSSVGFEIREASNGQEGVQEFKHWDPHLIWLDMRMPVMDGYETARQIRKLERQRAKGEGQREVSQYPIPIIALTAGAFEEQKIQVMAAGCNGFVRKPFRESEIFEIMYTYLGVQYLYEEIQESGGVASSHLTERNIMEALTALPSDLRSQLEQAVIRSYMEEILTLIHDLRQYDPELAQALMILADNFEYENILVYLQMAKERAAQ